MDLELKGKTALVTGASKGIGRATAELLAEEGANVYLLARNRGPLEKAQHDLISKYNVGVEIVPADLSVSGVPEDVARRCREIDILVNNAGAIPAGTLQDIDESTWRAAWDLKVFGYINLTRACYENMRARGGGVIVNVIGTGGERHDGGYIAGAAGNAGLMAFTRALGGQSHRHGIRVVGVNPGMTRTERLEALLRTRARMAGRDPREWQQMLGKLPYNRPAEAREVADVVVFAASARASYVSGTVITVDAGKSIGG